MREQIKEAFLTFKNEESETINLKGLVFSLRAFSIEPDVKEAKILIRYIQQILLINKEYKFIYKRIEIIEQSMLIKKTLNLNKF